MDVYLSEIKEKMEMSLCTDLFLQSVKGVISQLLAIGPYAVLLGVQASRTGSPRWRRD